MRIELVWRRPVRAEIELHLGVQALQHPVLRVEVPVFIVLAVQPVLHNSGHDRAEVTHQIGNGVAELTHGKARERDPGGTVAILRQRRIERIVDISGDLLRLRGRAMPGAWRHRLRDEAGQFADRACACQRPRVTLRTLSLCTVTGGALATVDP